MDPKHIYPIGVNPKHPFGITPFGFYCFDCKVAVGNVGVPISNDVIKKHISRKKHGICSSVSIGDIVRSLNDAMKSRFGNVRGYDLWIVKENMPMIKCSCGITVSNNSNLNRHIKAMEKKNSEETHIGEKIDGVLTTCGRMIPTTTINELMCKPIDLVTLDPAMSQYSMSTITGPESSKNQVPTKNYLPVQSNNKKWLSTTVEDVRVLFNEYKRLDEKLDPYLPGLKLLVIDNEDCVITRIKNDLMLMDYEMGSTLEEEDDDGGNVDTDSVLKFFLECTVKWVKVYCREHVNMLDGRVRFKLHSFFDESNSGLSSGYNMNFNMRDKEEVIWKELKLLITLSWRLHAKGGLSDGLNSLLDPIVQMIKDFEKKYSGNVSKVVVEDMIQSLCIQKYLHFILIESKSNAYSLILGVRMAMVRLFMLKKVVSSGSNSSRSDENVNETEERKLCLRSCGEFGSILALHLHIYRLGSASLLACTESSVWDMILDEVSNSSLFHIISPMINKVGLGLGYCFYFLGCFSGFLIYLL